MTNDSTIEQSERIAVLEVMVEMLTAQSMDREAAPEQAMDDYRDVASMILAERVSDAHAEGVAAILHERVTNVREHLHAIRRARNQRVH